MIYEIEKDFFNVYHSNTGVYNLVSDNGEIKIKKQLETNTNDELIVSTELLVNEYGKNNKDAIGRIANDLGEYLYNHRFD